MKRRQILGVLVAVLALTAWKPAAAAPANWDLYLIVGISSPVAVQLKQFADEVKKRTHGELAITVRPAGELPFKATEMLRITGEGQVQLGEAIAVFTSGSVPLLGVASLPMFLRSPAEMQKAMPIIRKYVDKEFEKAGVKVLFPFLWPSQNVFGRGKPLRAPEDFAGRKLRTTSPPQAEMLKRLGAASVALTTAEVPVALERGTMEGVVSSAFAVIGNKWAEFMKWAYIADFQGADDYIIVNNAAYDKLSPSTRQALDEVAREWGPKMTEANLAAEARDLEVLRTQYKVEVFTTPKQQVDSITDKMKDYWTVWAQQTGPAAVAMLGEIRVAIGK